MDLSALTSFAVPVVVGICLCTGYVLKNAVTSDAVNKYIPLIMAAEGILLNFWMAGTMSPDVLLGGMFSGLASTGLYEAFKNLLSQSKTA
jgi:hypothetical protein